MITPAELELMKDRLKKNKGNIWHGFISLSEEESYKIDTPEKCIKFVKNVFGTFFKTAHLEESNMDLMCALHSDRPHHLHIHFQFWEKEPKCYAKDGTLKYRSKGKIEKRAIDKMFINAGLYLDDDRDNVYKSRMEALRELKGMTAINVAITTKDEVKEELLKLVKELPKDKDYSYSNIEMQPYRERVDNIVSLLLSYDREARKADREFYEALSLRKQKVEEIINTTHLFSDENVNLDDLMDDIEQAMGFVKEIGDSHGVEISGFLSTGGSAGGHLSLHYAYSRADSSPIPPKAVVSYCGPADLADEYYYYNEELQANNGIGDKETVAEILGYASGYPHTYATRAEAKEALKFVSPIYYIDENTVPTVINHGVKDDIVPYRNAVDLDAKLTEYGVEHVFNSYPTSGHGLELDAENMARAEQLLWEYIVKYLDSVNV